MVERADARPPGGRRVHRRTLLGGAVLGATGAALAPLVPPVGPKGTGPSRAHPTDPAGPGSPATAGSGGDGPGSPHSLRVAGLVAPLGLGRDDVVFSWLVEDGRRGARQRAYRIVVKGPIPGSPSTPAPTVWDTGVVDSPEQAFVAYGGPTLAPDAAYRWTVQTWDETGRPGPASVPAVFETGLTDLGWRASWIRRVENETTEPCQYTYARREFTLTARPIHRARAYVSGDQQYELSVNGVRAGKGQAYSYPDSKYYEALDVTGLLRPGAPNAVAILTNWQGPTKGHPAGSPGVVAELVVHHVDGTTERVVTDGSWRVAKGAWLPGTQRDLEGDLVDYTETIDGPAQPVGWDRPGFDDRSWAPAVVLGRAPTAPWTRLVPVRTRIVEEPVPAVSLTTLASGAVVADFGKVYAAVPTVRFRHGVPGRPVTMRAGFLLDQPVAGVPFDGVPGQVSTTHGTQHTDMSYGYVQRGGDEWFHPFDYLGFRYFQIDQPGEDLAPGDVVARARHTAMPEQPVGTFSSSEPTIDAEFQLGAHSALYTAQEQYIDTPTREKGSWLFDGFNESRTAMAVFGEQNLTRKSLQEFAQSQARYWPNGAVNKIYPTGLGALDINESTEAYVEWVWQYWMHTGDRALVESVYGVVEKIGEYVYRAVDPDTGLVTSLPSTNVYYDTPVVTRLNVLGANVFRRAAALGLVLGRPNREVARNRARQAHLTDAVNRRLTRADGIYVDGLGADGTPTSTASQTANACAAAYGLVPAPALDAVGRYVSSLGMQATPQNAGEVLSALARAGRTSDLVALLIDSGIDGWANILSRGATFTWEVWNPSDVIGDSMSHGWGATMVPEIQHWLLGVRPTAPGFARFEVSPPPAGLDWALGSVPTPRGTVSVAWRRQTRADGHFSVDLDVPPNSTATLTVPADRADGITEGGRPLSGVEGVRLVAVGGGTARLHLGSGTYRIRSEVPA